MFWMVSVGHPERENAIRRLGLSISPPRCSLTLAVENFFLFPFSIFLTMVCSSPTPRDPDPPDLQSLSTSEIHSVPPLSTSHHEFLHPHNWVSRPRFP